MAASDAHDCATACQSSVDGCDSSYAERRILTDTAKSHCCKEARQPHWREAKRDVAQRRCRDGVSQPGLDSEIARRPLELNCSIERMKKSRSESNREKDCAHRRDTVS